MCKKLTGSESGLVAYWKLDESSVSNPGYAADSTDNHNDGIYNGDMTNDDCVWSGAAIGDASTYNYTTSWTGVTINLAHSNGDDITVSSVTGTANPDGVQVYRVDEAPNVTTPPAGYDKIDPLRYWGVFVVGGASPTYTVTYNYDGHLGISNESALKLAKRTNGAAISWADTGATLNEDANTLTKSGESGTEYILGTTSSDNSLPVELSTFTAATSDGKVTLHWRTESEVENLGFYIYRSESKDGPFVKVNDSMGAGNSPFPHEYEYTDRNVEAGHRYFYYIEDVDISGMKDRSKVIEVFVPTVLPKELPKEFALLQNFPNPFNPDTWIPYQLAEATSVEIRIYDSKGRLVRNISLGKKDAGYYKTKETAAYWDGRDNLGQPVASGVYFYQIKAGDFVNTRKMVVVK